VQLGTSSTAPDGTRDKAAGLSELGAWPEELVANAERLALLRKMVEQLPDRERKVVEGYYFAGQTLGEVGARAGATESWASRMLARAVETIQRELKRCDSVALQTRAAPKP
jgi:RNA polymerase sigma factor for flagellar operon FliA